MYRDNSGEDKLNKALIHLQTLFDRYREGGFDNDIPYMTFIKDSHDYRQELNNTNYFITEWDKENFLEAHLKMLRDAFYERFPGESPDDDR